MLVPERVRKSVVFIGRSEGGDFVPYGTAFFLRSTTEGRRFAHLVTAAHIISAIQHKSEEIVIRFNGTGDEESRGIIPFRDWRFHPGADIYRHVDVAVAPVNMPANSDHEFVELDLDGATDEVIEREGIGPGEEVFLAGFFKSHYGKKKNVPIVRVGNIAAMPEEPIETETGPMFGYLVETRSIHGLSGSPVFVHLAPWRVVNNRVVQLEGAQCYLIGLMKGFYKAPGKRDNTEPLNTGISVVVPTQDIVETIMQPELENERRKIVEDMKKRGADLVETADQPEVDARRDGILKTMLNTPPQPKKSGAK